MKDFIVEDRKAGEVVLQGKISSAGGIIVTASSEDLDEGQIKRIVDEIGRDVAAGHSGGRLGSRGLDWVEVLR